MMVEWNDVEYTDMGKYYREVVLTMPEEDGALLGATTHLDALASLSHGGLFVTEQDDADVYVDRWMVSGTFITHKHPEFGLVRDHGWTRGQVECDLRHGKCEMCGEKIPGEIEMMHHFYRLER
jgi:radical SAM superfamily enzyme with C-terminal helix-hairpin-helix motif